MQDFYFKSEHIVVVHFIWISSVPHGCKTQRRFQTTEAFVGAQNSYSLFLVLLSVNQSSDKERATAAAAAAAHTPGAKMRDSAWLSPPPFAPPLTTTLIPPLKTHSCLCLRGTGEMKGNMQCVAFDCELCSVIRGKFTGLVCVLNTL